MDFLKIVKRRSFLSEAIYISLNVALAIGLMFIVRSTNSILPAFGLVLLSKWRVLAVRPRYWFANIQGDLVSLIIAVSYIFFLYSVNIASLDVTKTLITQLLLTVIYIAWLLLLRPQSKRHYVAAQSGVALFSGITTIYSISHGWPASLVVLLVWLVGYAVARHVLNNYDDEAHTTLLSLAWGLLLAEIGWLAYHWTIAYNLPILSNILLPQVSIIMLCLGFLTYQAYNSYSRFNKVKMADIILPLIFTICIIIVLVLAFNSVGVGAIRQ
ncbi:MAG: hypothetical protein WCQ49_00190 [Candidatus Saccharibacteria bacterium]